MSAGDKMVMMNARAMRAVGLLSTLVLTVAAAGASAVQDTPQPPQTQRSPCDLLTKKEVEDVLGAKVSDPIRRGDACHFEPAGRPARGIIVTVHWTGGETHMGGVRLFQSIVRGESKFFSKYGHSNEDVQDLGDEASFPLETLSVLKGDAFLEIDAKRCSRQQAIALARKVLARM